MTRRDHLALTALAVLAVLATAWYVAVAPRREAAADQRSELAQARDRVAAARIAAIARSEPAGEDAEAMGYAASLGKAVPLDDALTSLGVQLQALARRAGVELESFGLASAAGGDAAPDAEAAPAAPASTTPAASLPATVSTTTPGSPPPGSAVDAAGVTTVPLDIAVSGTYLDVQDLLGRMDDLVGVDRGGRIVVRGRLLSVTAVTLAPRASTGRRVAASIRATAYLAPEDAQLVAAGGSASETSTTSGPTSPTSETSTR